MMRIATQQQQAVARSAATLPSPPVAANQGPTPRPPVVAQPNSMPHPRPPAPPSSAAATAGRPASESATRCAVCSQPVMMSNRRVCSECRRDVCPQCSTSATHSDRTNKASWICSVCDKRRQMMSATSRPQNQQQQTMPPQQPPLQQQRRETSVQNSLAQKDIRPQMQMKQQQQQQQQQQQLAPREQQEKERLLREQQLQEQQDLERFYREKHEIERQLREEERQKAEKLRQQKEQEQKLKEQQIKEQQEKERLQRERQERLEKERLERERLEKEKLEKEWLEKERQQKEQQERERQLREQQERERQQREEQERERQQEMERRQREQQEKERQIREQQQREQLERERIRKEQEEMERRQREQEEKERQLMEQQLREQQQRELLREQQERERQKIEHEEREERERQQRELLLQQQKEQQERERQMREQQLREEQLRAQQEKERLQKEREEQERQQREHEEKERQIREQQERERQKKEREAREAREREIQEQQLRERQEWERQQREQQEREKQRLEQLEKERLQREQQQIREQQERERQKKEQEERERQQRELVLKQQREQQEKERQMREKQLREQQERERQRKEQEEKERQLREQQLRERQEWERQQKEQQERERQRMEQLEKERLQREQQQLREQQERERKQREMQEQERQKKEQEERERQHREQQIREQQLREQKQREIAMRQQQQKEQQQREILSQQQQQQQQHEILQRQKDQMMREQQFQYQQNQQHRQQQQQFHQSWEDKQQAGHPNQVPRQFRDQQGKPEPTDQQWRTQDGEELVDMSHRRQQNENMQDDPFEPILRQLSEPPLASAVAATQPARQGSYFRRQASLPFPAEAQVPGPAAVDGAAPPATGASEPYESQRGVVERLVPDYDWDQSGAAFDYHFGNVTDLASLGADQMNYGRDHSNASISQLPRPQQLTLAASPTGTDDDVQMSLKKSDAISAEQAHADRYGARGTGDVRTRPADESAWTGQLAQSSSARHSGVGYLSRHAPAFIPPDDEVWSVLQTRVYPTSINSVDHLQLHFVEERHHFDHRSIEQTVRQWRVVRPRAGVCENSGHFEHSLQSCEQASKKMKPSALDRAGVHGAHHEQRQIANSSASSQSPSRRSEKSPPRSPSWMRHHRDSPPRTISPSISPTERFPESTFVDRPRPLDKLQVEEYEIRLDDGREFDFDVVMATSATGADAAATGVRASLPPKPARSDVYRLMTSTGNEATGPRPEDDDSSVLNVASFAAAVASDTAHLTRRSVSPLEFDGGRPLDHTPSSSGNTTTVTVTSSATGVTLAEPTPKTIDYQNARRQKGKPPSPSSAGTDWSPISDLSPIMDVSPSIERVEQDRMSTGGISRGLPSTGVRAASSQTVDSRRVLPNAPQQDVAPVSDAQYMIQRQPDRTDGTLDDVYAPSDVVGSEEDGVMMRSSLKRCPNFDNISSISSVNDVSMLQSNVRQESITIMSPAAGSRPRTSDSVNVPAGQSKFTTGDSHIRSTSTTDSASNTRADAERLIDSQQGTRLADTQLRTQESTRRQTADIPALSEREQRAMKTSAPAVSASDSFTRKQTSHAETDKSVKDQRITMPKSQVVVHKKQSDLTEKKDDSPASEVKKTRRRLPPVPVDAETVTARPARRIRSRSADSRVDESSVEKERLRRHLKLRELERHRSLDGDEPERVQSGSSSGDERVVGRGHQSRADSAPRRRRVLPDVDVATADLQTAITAKPGGRGVASQQTVKADARAAKREIQRRATTNSKLGIDAKSSLIKPGSAASTAKHPVNRPKRVELVNFRGVLVPKEVQLLKQRIKEELQIATASRRLRLDEAEEVRQMEVALAERERQIKLRAERQTRDEAMQRDQLRQAEADRIAREKLEKKQRQTAGRIDIRTSPDSKKTSNSRRSAHTAVVSRHGTGRQRHRRHGSDPTVAKFSPIEEDYDLDSWLRRYRLTDGNLDSRLYPVSGAGRLAANLPYGRARSATRGKAVAPTHWASDDDTAALKGIGGTLPLPRRTYLNPDISSSSAHRALSRSSEMLAKLSMLEKESRLCGSHSESSLPLTSLPVPRSRTPTYFSDGDDSADVVNAIRNREERKLQLQMEIGLRKLQLEETRYLQNELQKLAEMPDITPMEIDRARNLYRQRVRLHEQIPSGIIKPLDYQLTSDYLAGGGGGSGALLDYEPAWPSYETSLLHDSLLAQRLANRKTRLIPGVPTTYHAAEYASRYGPAAPAPRHSGRRPNHNVAQPVDINTLLSEQRAVDSDENIMEGGVTIRRRRKTRAPVDERIQRHYDFSTKRILLTRDPKDVSRRGHGFGVKIVGGKIISDKSNEVGAFVTAIQRGGIADQLHGELQEGDQVLEYNGIVLTGKTFEDVQRITSQPNGEIELVIKARSFSSKHSSTMSTIHTDSCQSSYDNLDAQSDSDDYNAMKADQQVDEPKTGRHRQHSPAASISSSQQDVRTGSSMSTSGSSEPTDIMSPVIENRTTLPPPPTPDNTQVSRSTRQEKEKPFGDIQLQLSFDSYDGSLNVHVIQARRLRPRADNSYVDPYVKLCLLPGRSSENKCRTRYVQSTCAPEWHQTLVFINLTRQQLASQTLELTVWDYDRFKTHDFLGEVSLNMSDASVLDNRPHWYSLQKRSRNSPGSASPPSGSFSPHRRGGGGGGGGSGGGGGGKPSSDRRQRDGAGRHAQGNQHAQRGVQNSTGREQRSKGQRQRGGAGDSETNLSQKSSSACTLTWNKTESCRTVLFVNMTPVHPETLMTKVLQGTLRLLAQAFFCCRRPVTSVIPLQSAA